MLLTEFYRMLLEKSVFWKAAARTHGKPMVCASFHRRAETCEQTASDLAHCIAAVGDMELPAVGSSALRDWQQNKTCEGRNPWNNGLTAVEEFLDPGRFNLNY
jgi:hypothetical protein